MTKVTLETDSLSLDCLLGLVMATAGVEGPDGQDADHEFEKAAMEIKEAFYARSADDAVDVLAKLVANHADDLDNSNWGVSLYRDALPFLSQNAKEHVVACLERYSSSNQDPVEIPRAS